MPLTTGATMAQLTRLIELLTADDAVNDIWQGTIRSLPVEALPMDNVAGLPVVSIYCPDGHTGFASKQSNRVRNRYVMVTYSRWDEGQHDTTTQAMYETAINTRDALAAALLRLRRDPTPVTQYWHKLMFVGEHDQPDNPGAGESSWSTKAEPGKWFKTITHFYLSLDARS